MKKELLKKKIVEIGKYLESEKAQDALDTLLEELKGYVAPQIEAKPSGDFNLPKEVSGKSNALALFTDGACRGNPGPGSWAFMIQDHDGKVVKESAEATDSTTNNRMELSAIIHGLKYLSNEVSPMHEVYIYTDSKLVVDGMKSWVHNWKKRGWKKADNKEPANVELWKELDQLVNICHISFNWVKGHAGHPQNEHVDQLANKVLDENGF